MMACIGEPISWLRLERYALSATDAGVREHVASCEACRHCLDEIQRDVGQGPLYAAETDDWRLVVPDVADEPRWPAYGARVAELGIRSQMAIRLRVTGRRRALLYR